MRACTHVYVYLYLFACFEHLYTNFIVSLYFWACSSAHSRLLEHFGYQDFSVLAEVIQDGTIAIGDSVQVL